MKEFALNNTIYRETIFPDYYITNDGEVAQIKFSNGKLESFFLMKCELCRNGYLRIEINHKHYLIHRLVYQTWSNDKLDVRQVIDHIDANPLNNHISNLRQVSQSQNIQNAMEHGNFGHNHNTKIEVYDKETQITQSFDSIKDFFISINAPEYIINHGGLHGLKKRKEYKKYIVRKINEH